MLDILTLGSVVNELTIFLCRDRRDVYSILVGRPEGKRPLGRPGRRWEDNIKMNLQETGWGVWTGASWPHRYSWQTCV